MSRQDQKAEAGAEAYQAGNNIVIHQGVTPKQMADIMVEMSRQLITFAQEANQKVEERLQSFRESILEEFSREETRARSDAFRDPDFQFVLHSAQQSFARSGEESLREELVKLLSERSTQPNGGRRAMILNKAIETAGVLSVQEYATIAMLFALARVGIQSPSAEHNASEITKMIAPFIDDADEGTGSIEYLESIGCLTKNVVVTNPLEAHLGRSYSLRTNKGFSIEELNLIPTAEKHKLSMLLFGINNELIALVGDGWDDIATKLRARGLAEEYIDILRTAHQQGVLSEDAVGTMMLASSPILQRAAAIWTSSGMHQCSLTGLGKVIGHSALQSKGVLDAPLDIWVK